MHLTAIKRPSTSVSRQTPNAKGLIKKNKHADGLPQYIPAKNSLSTLKIKHRKFTKAASSRQKSCHAPPRNALLSAETALCGVSAKAKKKVHKPTAREASTRNVCITVEHRFYSRK
ncbi:hypothetical protein TcCL_ESM09823 [Trypanosoma cruzi]|nr:hypothetical protein TcCL_ESM09823 [Trypanosoma cruzi]